MIGKESGASDIHLAVGSPPSWRRFGALEPIWLEGAILTAADTERLAAGFLTDGTMASDRRSRRRGLRLFEFVRPLPGLYREAATRLRPHLPDHQQPDSHDGRAGVASSAQAAHPVSQRSGPGDRLRGQRQEHHAGCAGRGNQSHPRAITSSLSRTRSNTSFPQRAAM